MATKLHRLLTGTDLHEPKGLAAVTGVHYVYKSDGAGGGAWSYIDATDIASTGTTAGQILVSDGAGNTVWTDSGGAINGEMTITNNTTVLGVTAVADTTFNTDSQYIKVNGGLWAEGVTNGVTFDSSGYLEIVTPGVYQLAAFFIVSMAAGPGTNLFALKFSVDDTNASLSPRKVKRQSNNADDVGSLSATNLVHLDAGDKLSLWIACDITTDITFHDAGLTCILLAAD